MKSFSQTTSLELTYTNNQLVIMKTEETYQVEEYLRYRVSSGVEEILLSWVGYNKPTWEPISSLVLSSDDDQYLKLIRNKYKAVLLKLNKRGIDIDGIEIINPHLKNADKKQKKLEMTYYEKAHDLEDDAFIDESQEQQSIDQVAMMKPRNRGRGRGRGNARGQTSQRQIQSNSKLSSQYLSEQQSSNKIVKPNELIEANEFEKMETTKKMSKDEIFRAKLKKLQKSMLQERSQELEQSEYFENDEPVTHDELSHLKRLINQNCSIKKTFTRQKQLYYEVQFDCSELKYPIIFHESYIRKLCPKRMAEYLVTKIID